MDDESLKLLTKRLPQHPNVLGRDRYFNAAVLIPLLMINGEYHLLFQKRAPDIRQGSEICFPGGKYDHRVDKNFEDTAIRETCEELGVVKKQITILGQLDSLVAPMGAVVDSFLATIDIDNLNDLDINHDEVEKVFTIPVSFFTEDNIVEYCVRLEMHSSVIDENGEKKVLLPSEELGLPDIYHGTWAGKDHRVITYKSDEGIIWGITAEIIKELVEFAGFK